MDPIVLAAASSLVGAMATDGWQHARDATVALWRRLRPAAAVAVEGQLTADRSALLTARQTGDGRTEQLLVEAWLQRFAELRAEEGVEQELLNRLVAHALAPALAMPSIFDARTVRMSAEASGSARIYQSGHDQTINETPS